MGGTVWYGPTIGSTSTSLADLDDAQWRDLHRLFDDHGLDGRLLIKLEHLPESNELRATYFDLDEQDRFKPTRVIGEPATRTVTVPCTTELPRWWLTTQPHPDEEYR